MTIQNLDLDYLKGIAKRVKADAAKKADDSKTLIITRDENPPQVGLTPGWLYVPSIGMEFSTRLHGEGLNWYDAHKLAKPKNCVMPTLDETWELFFHAKTNLDKMEFANVYSFLNEKSDYTIFHGEWQDAYFIEKKGKMYMHRLKDFTAKGEPIFFQGSAITGTYLKDFKDYANICQRLNLTTEGLCYVADVRDHYVPGANISFEEPVNDRVACFGVCTSKVGLDCNIQPDKSFVGLGVRFARRVGKNIKLEEKQ